MVKVYYFYHPSLCKACPAQLATFLSLAQQYNPAVLAFYPMTSENDTAQNLMDLSGLQYVPSVLIDKDDKTVKKADGIDNWNANDLAAEIYKATKAQPTGLGNYGVDVISSTVRRIPWWGWVIIGLSVVAAFVFFGKWKKYKFLKFIK